MRPVFFTISFILLCHFGHSQTLLDAYKKSRLEHAKSLKNSAKRIKFKNYVKSHVVELDTIFQSYKAKTGFDFNHADTVFFIYDAPAESPFMNDVIIWSGNDTITYSQGFETVEPGKYRRTIFYKPFIHRLHVPDGYKAVTERDSLITLVSKRKFDVINHLGDGQSVHDGSYTTIFAGYRQNGKYRIESCFPRKFMMMTIYRKE